MVKAVPLQANLNNASGVGTAINDYVQDQEISDVVIGSRNLGSVRKCAAWPGVSLLRHCSRVALSNGLAHIKAALGKGHAPPSVWLCLPMLSPGQPSCFI